MQKPEVVCSAQVTFWPGSMLLGCACAASMSICRDVFFQSGAELEVCSELELLFLASHCCVSSQEVHRNTTAEELLSLTSCKSVTCLFQLHLYCLPPMSLPFLVAPLLLLLLCAWLMSRGLVRSLLVPMSSRNSQNNIISSLLFLVSHESEIYTELNYILYLTRCFNCTNILQTDLTNIIALKGRTPSVLSVQVTEKKSERMSSFRNFNYQLISLTHQAGGVCLPVFFQSFLFRLDVQGYVSM